MTYVCEAIKAAGGVDAVANKFSISQEAVYKWIRQHRVPFNRVLELCQLGAWKVTPHQLCPTFYPQAHDGLPLGQKSVSKPRQAVTR